MGFSLEEISSSILSQITFVIMIIMAARAISAYMREDWGKFFGGLVMGILCLIVCIFGPQIQSIAEGVGNSIFN